MATKRKALTSVTITEKDICRFQSKVKAAENGCWEWQASLVHGYGSFGLGRQTYLAHRVAYFMATGSLPEGKVLHHTCENPKCVNPAHLQPLTRVEHIAVSPAMVSYPRPARSHCKNGHEMTEANTFIHRGSLECRACERERVGRYHARKRAEAGPMAEKVCPVCMTTFTPLRFPDTVYCSHKCMDRNWMRQKRAKARTMATATTEGTALNGKL